VQNLAELPGVHRGGADVASLARLHHVVEGFERLLDGRRLVHAMDLVEVHIVRAEAPQAMVDLGQDGLARQAGAIRIRTHRVTHLSRDHDLIPVREVLERTAENFLARPLRIHVRRVEEVDARVQRVLDERSACLLIQRPDRVASVGIAVGHRADSDG
jgi:hypothetical protein